MGRNVCKELPGVSSITLFLPNIHNIPFNFEPFGMENKDATGEPDVLVTFGDYSGYRGTTTSYR